MLGIWFNHGDDYARKRPHDHLEILKRFGFTDFYILMKGTRCNVWEVPELRERVDLICRQARNLQIRTHGVFICSEAVDRLREHPEEGDFLRSGARSDTRISHVNRAYQQWLLEAMQDAYRTFSLDGIQLDFLRYGTIGYGWSPEEETIYASFGVDVPALRQEIASLYNPEKPSQSLMPLFSRLEAGDPMLNAFVLARRSVIRGWLKTVSENLRQALPGAELSVAMMPEGLETGHEVSELHYGQNYQGFQPFADHLFPMAYSAVFGKGADWVGAIGRRAAAEVPGAVIGLECTEPSTAVRLRDTLQAISGLKLDGICLFRYGRLILALRDGEDTILYNSYAGTVNRLILIRGTTEEERTCMLEEASFMRLTGHWDLIRAFGRFQSSRESHYEGELCVVGDWQVQDWVS